MTLPFTDSTRTRARRPLAILATIAALGAALAGGFATRQAEGANAKNVVFILTDDQTASELGAMPWTQLLIANRGVSFRRAYAPYPLCCPSRVSLLTGEYTHNHGVRGNDGPAGGWPAFQRHEPNALPVWTHDDGYYNVHIGKYMNGYLSSVPGVIPVPPGWDQWYGKTSQDSLYFNYPVIEKTGPEDEPQVVFYGANPSDFQTDVFRDKAVEFVKDLTANESPFMMNVWFNAPHGPFDPAPRDLFTRSTTPLPRLPGFDEKDISDKPPWLRGQAKQRMSKGLRQTIVAERRRREEQLASVDEAVKQLVNTLASEGILDDTYIVFASDNGFFRGEHRIAGGKYLAHEPSARVPLLIRGPGIPAGGVSDEVVSLIDVPQTILDIAGDPDPALDGRSLLPHAQSPLLRSTRPVLIEADTGHGTGGALDPAQSSAGRAIAKVHLAERRGVKNLDQEPNPIKSLKAAANGNFAPAYKAIRTDRYLYVLYANGQTELYDMLRDPNQLRSLSRDPRYRPVRKWLFNQLVPLSSCKGGGCRLEIGVEPLPRKGPKPKAKRKKGKGGKERR
jgi:N-acetylglucosamine-6-sulfatase